MKKIINKKHNKNEPWFKWLTRELNSYEAFQDFESGKNPQDVAAVSYTHLTLPTMDSV